MSDHEAYLAWWNDKGVTQPRVTNEQTWHAGIAHELVRLGPWVDHRLYCSKKNMPAVDTNWKCTCGLDEAREVK